MKIKSLIATLILTVGFTSNSVFADTVKFTNGFGTTNGGEFIADSATNVWNGTFITFCLELNEGMSFNTPYDYVIGTAAVNGGLSGGNPDPLSQGSAYLYSSLRQNTLASGNGFGSYYDIGTRTANSDLFQQAIWTLEGEGAFATTTNNWYYAQAIANGGAADATNLMGVRVMNIARWETVNEQMTYVQKQSVLYYVPDSGMTIALLGLGLLSLLAFRRKL